MLLHIHKWLERVSAPPACVEIRGQPIGVFSLLNLQSSFSGMHTGSQGPNSRHQVWWHFYPVSYFESPQKSCVWTGEMAQQVRALTALPKVLNSATTWWLTATRNEIWCPLLVCVKSATGYLHIIINKSLKKYCKMKPKLGHPRKSKILMLKLQPISNIIFCVSTKGKTKLELNCENWSKGGVQKTTHACECSSRLSYYSQASSLPLVTTVITLASRKLISILVFFFLKIYLFYV